MELVDNKTVILTSTTKTVRVGRLSMRDTFDGMLSKYGFAPFLIDNICCLYYQHFYAYFAVVAAYINSLRSIGAIFNSFLE